MNKVLFIILSITLFFSCSEPKAPVKISVDKTLYGDSISIDNAMTLSALQQKMTTEEEMQDVLVSGEIVGTCAVKGCWMTINNGDAEPMRVRFKDYGFFVPTEGAEGKKTVFKGKAFKEEVSVEWQHHYIDDSDAPEEEKAKLKSEITEPKKVLSFLADGVVIID